MSERQTAVVRFVDAEKYPHASTDRYRAEWLACRGREFRVYLPAEENLGYLGCEIGAPVWRVHEEDVASLSPRIAAELEHFRKTIPDVGYFVCAHQIQAPPADPQAGAPTPPEDSTR